MAAMWLAYMMYVPALAARDPAGATQVTTGTSEARILRMMSRMEASSPPGVFMRSTTTPAPSRSARVMLRAMWSRVAGPMASSTVRT